MRNRLPHDPPTHAGLALQRYLKLDDKHQEERKKQEARNQAVRRLLEQISKNHIPQVYKELFNRWKASLSEALFIEATTITPLAIGLGNPSPLENGLAIHHTYGTPYLPGSALKGLVRRAADRFGLSPEEKAVLLGQAPDPKGQHPGSAAYLVYWDGWLGPQNNSPFQKDVITVHHQNYYTSGGADWPTDFDDPNPVAFLSVKPGTKFCIALSSTSQGGHDWLVVAAELLEWGLEHLGLGGKTNAGYGYFGQFKRIVPEKPKTQAELSDEVSRQTQEVLSQVKDASSLSKIDDYLPKLEELEPTARRSSLEAIKSHLIAMKRWDLEKSRCQRIQRLLEES